jgi:hypothetical protein
MPTTAEAIRAAVERRFAHFCTEGALITASKRAQSS